MIILITGILLAVFLAGLGLGAYLNSIWGPAPDGTSENLILWAMMIALLSVAVWLLWPYVV